ncbi:hypothetical protein EQ500_04060 [Lactobacillus sp. XV13L]|nr:hypothetical protein [Lactobacillus sp. XV13L]
MNILKWSNKKWLKIYSYELLFCILSLALLILFFHGWASKPGARGVALTVILLIGGTNLYCLRSSRPNQIVHGISKWLNIVIVPTYLCSCWVLLGNLLLKTLPQVEILTVILLWLIYVVLLLPLAMSWAATVKNWFLRLLAITFIGIQYGPDARLNVDRHLTLMHAITSQGVIAALSLFVLACFLGYAWGFRFNPNLKFRKGPNFQQSVFVILLLFTLIDLLYNCFNAYNQDLWSALFRYDIGSLKFSGLT